MFSHVFLLDLAGVTNVYDPRSFYRYLSSSEKGLNDKFIPDLRCRCGAVRCGSGLNLYQVFLTATYVGIKNCEDLIHSLQSAVQIHEFRVLRSS